MAITSNSVFGGRSMGLAGASAARGRQTQTEEAYVPSEFWVNIGYLVDLKDENDVERTDFIALNKGIPLDSVALLQTSTTNDVIYGKISAQNQLLMDLRDATKDLAPGETKILSNDESGLVIQLLRVKAKREAPTVAENPFARKFNFAKA